MWWKLVWCHCHFSKVPPASSAESLFHQFGQQHSSANCRKSLVASSHANGNGAGGSKSHVCPVSARQSRGRRRQPCWASHLHPAVFGWIKAPVLYHHGHTFLLPCADSKEWHSCLNLLCQRAEIKLFQHQPLLPIIPVLLVGTGNWWAVCGAVLTAEHREHLKGSKNATPLGLQRTKVLTLKNLVTKT